MKPSPAFARALLRALVGGTALLGMAAPAAFGQAAPDVDRTDDETIAVAPRTDRAQDRLRRELGAHALLDNDPSTGTPRIVGRLDGFLSGPSSEAPEAVALGYLREHAAAFGMAPSDVAALHLSSRERGPDGTVHLAWQQRSGGIPNVDGGLQAAVTEEGRLINVRGGVLPGGDAEDLEPLVGPAVAYAAAVPGAAPVPPPATSGSADRKASFAGGGWASLVTYQDEGVERLGWQLLVPGGPAAFYRALVDARSGRLMRRANLVHSASTINHFDVNPLAEGGEVTTSDVPEEWLAPTADALDGTYVHAVSDVNDAITNDVVRATGPDYAVPEPDAADEVAPLAVNNGESQWNFEPDLGFCSNAALLCSWNFAEPTANREFSTVQLFWYVNTFRDHLAQSAIGFTGGGGGGFEAGADRVVAQSLDGAAKESPEGEPTPHLNNASMLTLPDGHGALMQVYLFRIPIEDAPDPRYDGAHDAGLVYHEYAHALSDRLTADADGISTLSLYAQSQALGEGISDFYALDFLAQTQPDHVPDTTAPGEVLFASRLGELRTEAIDCAVGDAAAACPGAGTAGSGGYDYGDFGSIDDAPPLSPHGDGEIWGQTLWSLRAALVADHGPEGLTRVRRYLTDGIRLAPEFPSFLELRNAILQAAVTQHGDEDVTRIWEVFASRGMGWSAATAGPQDNSPSASFDLPPAVATGAATGVQQNSVTLTGLVDSNGTDTDYIFQVGTTASYGAATLAVSAGSGLNPVGVAETIVGLSAGTTYHYRLVAVRGGNRMVGADRTVTTLAPSQPPPTNPPPTNPPPPNPVRPTLLLDTKLTAKRKGTFKVRTFFGDAAPAGAARFTVLNKRGKRFARALTPVRIGGNVIKTLRLNKRGRKAIRPGKSKRVTLELRLPNGQKFKKSLRLSRRR